MQAGKIGKEIWFPEFLDDVRHETALQLLVWSG
jgi:hypothetical protein